jgi:parallel beta-helix repeat protein
MADASSALHRLARCCIIASTQRGGGAVVSRLRRLPTAAALACAVLGFIWLYPGQASAKNISCGDTITQNTKLTSDLIGCPSVGIAIGADGITLDLNGHVIEGAPGSSGPNDVGILNGSPSTGTEGHANVVVENGTVRGFDTGIGGAGGSKDVFRRLTIAHNSLMGIACGCSASIIVDSVLLDNLDTEIIAPPDGRIAHTFISGLSRAGIQLTRNVLVDNNYVTGNSLGIDMTESGGGNVIRNNYVSGNILGIHFGDDSGELVSGNTVVDNESGMVLGDAHNSHITHNVISGNQGDGLTISDGSNGVDVTGNTANENGNDGIHVFSPGNVLSKNTANRNGSLGIEAVEGTVDGGGNRAFGNGNPLQCVNVVCK